MHIVLRRIGLAAAYAVSLLLIAWSLPAMFIGIFRIGSLLPFGLGIVLTIVLAKRKSLARLTGAGRVVLRVGIAGLCCFAVAFVVTSICMLDAVGRFGKRLFFIRNFNRIFNHGAYYRQHRHCIPSGRDAVPGYPTCIPIRRI